MDNAVLFLKSVRHDIMLSLTKVFNIISYQILKRIVLLANLIWNYLHYRLELKYFNHEI